MLKDLFWSKYMTQLRDYLGVIKKLDLPIPPIPVKRPPPTFTTFSGGDFKFYFEDEEGCFRSVPAINQISVVAYPDSNIHGELTSILHRKDTTYCLESIAKNILIEACDEHGAIAYTKFYDVQFTSSNWAATIDDIITEIHVRFVAKKQTPWTPVDDKKILNLEQNFNSVSKQIQERLSNYQ